MLTLCITLAVLQLPLGKSFGLLYEGALADKFAIARSLLRALPLCVCGLGIVVAWKAGTFNIGGEGQYVVGGILGGLLAAHLSTGGTVGIAALLAVCTLGGALWSLISGFLFTFRRVPVVISSIMLNFVATQLLDWALHGPIQEKSKQLPETDTLPATLRLPMFDSASQLHWGLAIAVVLVALTAVFLARTEAGFLLRLCGSNPMAARANRIPAWRYQLLGMALSGALCGMTGGLVYTGSSGQISSSFAQGWGFFAIPVALLADLNPILVLWVALMLGALFAGTEQIGRFTPGGNVLVSIVQGASVLAVLGAQIAWARWQRAKGVTV